jgi:hypothetical protein
MRVEEFTGQMPTPLRCPLIHTLPEHQKFNDFFKVLRKVPKTSHSKENAPKSPNLILSFRNYGIIMAKFKFEQLREVGIWPVNPSSGKTRHHPK